MRPSLRRRSAALLSALALAVAGVATAPTAPAAAGSSPTSSTSSASIASGTSSAVRTADGETWPAPFTHCPVGVVTNPETGATTSTCIAAVGRAGTFKLGKTVVTLGPGTDLQGGLGSTPDGPGFILANDGHTLSGPDQSVPGGVLGIASIQDLLPGVTDIAAEVRLVGTPEFVLAANVRITLPIQVRLKNGLLGNSCVIGTPETPIVLQLTSGTTTPPEGVEPMTGFNGTVAQPALGASVLEFVGQTVVDNTFAVPGATGCGPLGLLNGTVNGKSGLPAAPGESHASLMSNTFAVSAADAPNVSGYVPGM